MANKENVDLSVLQTTEYTFNDLLRAIQVNLASAEGALREAGDGWICATANRFSGLSSEVVASSQKIVVAMECYRDLLRTAYNNYETMENANDMIITAMTNMFEVSSSEKSLSSFFSL